VRSRPPQLSPFALGAAADGSGVHFALYSEHATRVELCLYGEAGAESRVELAREEGFVWRGRVEGARPGLEYAYRVEGPSGPQHRFDPTRRLLDPYARLIRGDLNSGAARCVVAEEAFNWGGDRPPRTAWRDTVIYEAHVKGFTRRHPEVPEHLRGTYAGLASPAVIAHLHRLGVTAVELLPVHAFADEPRLLQAGLANYWGYNSIGYFAPEMRYSATGTLDEFKAMVMALHAAGLEVILDVVYNHTGEGDQRGPVLSFRGIDNAVYYRLDPANPQRYINYTGTGNTFNVHHPAVLRLVMDSLRYWVSEMHVDGFRFDLATTLARGEFAFDKESSFLSCVAQDPVLSQVKLIAEPWDLGDGGYRLGGFPPGWSEWNDKFRTTGRAFWKGEERRIGKIAARLGGSEDLFRHTGRGPCASVNFVTAHDGFTLHDLVSYNEKHNEANGEGNRDGAEHNRSSNYGVEGPTEDPAIVSVREKQKRNLLATLLLSRGTPMLLAGDELGHTQNGNNNAYCQDNEISWLDWNLDERRGALLEFTARLVALRKEHPALHNAVYSGEITWLTPNGGEMTEADWGVPFARCIGALIPEGSKDLLLLLNAHDGEISFVFPDGRWTVLLETSLSGGSHTAEKTYLLQPRSLALLGKASS
jgi:glycogen operon protein